MIGGALAPGLHQQAEPLEITPVPWNKGREQGQTFRIGRHLHQDTSSFRYGCQETGLVSDKPLGRYFRYLAGRGQDKRSAIRCLQFRCIGIHIEGAEHGIGQTGLRAGYKAAGADIAVIAFGKIPVIGSNDGIPEPRLNPLPGPLTDTGAAGIGQHRGPDGLKTGQLSIPLDGGTHLLGTWGQQDRNLQFQTFRCYLLGHGGQTPHILVGGIGAGSNQGIGHVGRIVTLSNMLFHGRNRGGKIRRMGTHQMRFQGGKINLNDLIIVFLRIRQDLSIGLQEMQVFIGKVCRLTPPTGMELGGHMRVIGKGRGGRAQLGAHIADGGLAGAGKGGGARSEIFKDPVGASGTGEHTQDL